MGERQDLARKYHDGRVSVSVFRCWRESICRSFRVGFLYKNAYVHLAVSHRRGFMIHLRNAALDGSRSRAAICARWKTLCLVTLRNWRVWATDNDVNSRAIHRADDHLWESACRSGFKHWTVLMHTWRAECRCYRKGTVYFTWRQKRQVMLSWRCAILRAECVHSKQKMSIMVHLQKHSHVLAKAAFVKWRAANCMQSMQDLYSRGGMYSYNQILSATLCRWWSYAAMHASYHLLVDRTDRRRTSKVLHAFMLLMKRKFVVHRKVLQASAVRHTALQRATLQSWAVHAYSILSLTTATLQFRTWKQREQLLHGLRNWVAFTSKGIELWWDLHPRDLSLASVQTMADCIRGGRHARSCFGTARCVAAFKQWVECSSSVAAVATQQRAAVSHVRSRQLAAGIDAWRSRRATLIGWRFTNCRAVWRDMAQSVSTVRRGGEVLAFGSGAFGQLGNGNEADISTPSVVPGLGQLRIQVSACGEYHTALLSTAGELYTFGIGQYGVLGHGSETKHCTPRRVERLANEFVTSVACGWRHTAALTKFNALYTWGHGAFGQLGHGGDVNFFLPLRLEAYKEWVQVACGWRHTAALDVQGSTLTWGDGEHLQLGHGNRLMQATPKAVAMLAPTTIAQVECGSHHCLAFSAAGQVYTWGSGGRGQLGHGRRRSEAVPRVVAALSELCVVRVACGGHSLAVTDQGLLFTWGDGKHGQLGHGCHQAECLPRVVKGLSESQVIGVASGDFHSIALTNDGQVYTWGSGLLGELGHDSLSKHTLPRALCCVPGMDLIHAACGSSHTVLVFSAQNPDKQNV